MKKLRTAIIGMGVVGKRRRYFIEKNDNYKIVAVSDITFQKDTKKNNVYYYKNYENIKNHNLDCVFVTLPNYLAPIVTSKFLKKNVSVFCEKPPGRNIGDIKKIIKVEKKSSGKLMYGFNHRYHGSVEQAKNIIQKKTLGEVLNIRGLYGKSKIVTYNKGEWRSKKKFAGGGILLDQGIHMLDMINYFCGPFSNFKSFVSNRHWKYDIEDDVFSIFKNKSGVIASIHSTAIQWEHKFRIEISLQKGSIELNGILSGTKSYGSESLTLVKVKNNKFKNKITKKTIYYKKDNSWKKEIEEFAKILIKDNKKGVIKGSSKEALEVMNMIDSIYKNDKKILKK
jgi:predicted dehydrogenase